MLYNIKKPGFLPLRMPFIKGLPGAYVSALILFHFFPVDFRSKNNIIKAFPLFYIIYLPYLQNPVSFIFPKKSTMANTSVKQPRRMIIFAQDIMIIHACSASSASRKIKEVKDHLNKADHQEVTIKEYCDYFGLAYEETCEFLKLA